MPRGSCSLLLAGLLAWGGAAAQGFVPLDGFASPMRAAKLTAPKGKTTPAWEGGTETTREK